MLIKSKSIIPALNIRTEETLADQGVKRGKKLVEIEDITKYQKKHQIPGVKIIVLMVFSILKNYKSYWCITFAPRNKCKYNF